MKSSNCETASLIIFVLCALACKKNANNDVKINDFSYSGNSFTYNKISFKSTATGANTYQWDFGDGSISTDSVPVHTYKKADSFMVKLVLNNDTQHPIYKKILINSITQKFSGIYTAASVCESRQNALWPFDPTSSTQYIFTWPADTFNITGMGDTALNIVRGYRQSIIPTLYLTEITDTNMVFSTDFIDIGQVRGDVITYNISTNALDYYAVGTSDLEPPFIEWYTLEKIQ